MMTETVGDSTTIVAIGGDMMTIAGAGGGIVGSIDVAAAADDVLFFPSILYLSSESDRLSVCVNAM